jgi:hypothetical protein
MRVGKNVQQTTGIVPSEPIVQDEPGASGSSSTQPSANEIQPESPVTDVGPNESPRTTPNPQSQVYQNVLVECNSLIEEYRKGKVSKPNVYTDIQAKLVNALGEDRPRINAAFGSFIATVESHDSETAMAARRGPITERDRGASKSPVSDVNDPESDEEPVSKKPKVDESAFAWSRTATGKHTNVSENLTKTLDLLRVYALDLKATKRLLTNSPNCPEFPDSEWKNVIGGRAVNLDAVLSGQLSTTNDDLKVERFGDLELSFGAVEPTKIVKNGGDWIIAWNRTVRATTFAFPHRLQELTEYGEYVTSLFAVTHSTFHARVISYDKAVRKRAGSVRNVELSDYQKFADLKIAHMDTVGVSACAGGSTKGDSGRKQKRGKNWKKSEPCNKWNEGSCGQKEEDCRRDHVCNRCGKRGHKGNECRKPSA